MSNSLGNGCDRVPNQSCGEPRSTVYQGLIMQRCPVSRTTSQRRLKQTLSGCFWVIFKLLAASAETGASRFDDEFPHPYGVRKQRAQQSETMKSVFTLTSDLSHTWEAFWVGGCVVLDDLRLLLRHQRQNNSNSTWNSLSQA